MWRVELLDGQEEVSRVLDDIVQPFEHEVIGAYGYSQRLDPLQPRSSRSQKLRWEGAQISSVTWGVYLALRVIHHHTSHDPRSHPSVLMDLNTSAARGAGATMFVSSRYDGSMVREG